MDYKYPEGLHPSQCDTLCELVELYEKCIKMYTDDTEVIHILADVVLIYALKLCSSQLLSVHDRDAIDKILDIRDKCGIWYS